MINLPLKNINSNQCGKEIVHVNHVLIPGSPILREKSLEDCSFSDDPKHTVKLQNFGICQNFVGSFWKSSAIVGSCVQKLWHSAGKKISCHAQKKLAGISLHSLHIYRIQYSISQLLTYVTDYQLLMFE